MKKQVQFVLIFIFALSLTAAAQARGVRIGYIDTEYILENIPEYQEASVQLNDKVTRWKAEIDAKLQTVQQKRNALSNEKALLTTELINEREEEIAFEEQEILNFQHQRFGPNGDLIVQKKQLMQPIQDQIFSAVQDLATTKQYDFIFDKASETTMLFSAKRFDLSEQIIRAIGRTSKREQAESKSERKAVENEDVVPEINEELDERARLKQEKTDARKQAIEERQKEINEARETKIKEAEARRQQILADREAKVKKLKEERQRIIDEKNKK